jgi:hypothetical protein
MHVRELGLAAQASRAHGSTHILQFPGCPSKRGLPRGYCSREPSIDELHRYAPTEGVRIGILGAASFVGHRKNCGWAILGTSTAAVTPDDD